MFLSDGSLDVSKLSPALKEALSGFDLILSKAFDTCNPLIQPSHFFLSLLDIKGGLTQKIFKSKGIEVQTLIDLIHNKIMDESGDLPDIDLKREFFSPASLNLINELKHFNIDPLEEKHLLIVILKTLEDKVKKMFDGIIDIDDIIEYLHYLIKHTPVLPFDPETGEINTNGFDENGQIFLKLLKETAENTGYDKITSTHAGIALLSIKNGITRKGLRIQVVNPDKAIEAIKSRINTTNPKTNITFKKDSCYKRVTKILNTAAQTAFEERRPRIGDSQILRAILIVDEDGNFVDSLRQLGANIKSLMYFAECNLEVEMPPTEKEENTWKNLKERWNDLEAYLKDRIIGQDHTVEVLIKQLSTAVFGVTEGNKPIGVLFFAGPTGVGKTEISRVLTEFVFGNPDAMIRFDMSEFMESHTVAKFVGAPPGYVGYEEGGGLVNNIRDNPYSIILFDEFEKAHESIFNIYLQIFDNAALTDGHGNQAKFNNTLIILTSNLGAREAENTLSEEDRINAYQESFENKFPPEFRNRISNLIIFQSFSKDDRSKILELELNKLKKAYEREREIIFEFSGAIKKSLLEKCFDKNMGARPLRRVVWDTVNSLISLRIANGEIKKGDSVYLDEKKSEITFRVKR